MKRVLPLVVVGVAVLVAGYHYLPRAIAYGFDAHSGEKTQEPRSRVAHILEAARELDAVEGYAVYQSGSRGRFSLLSEFLSSWATDDEIVALLAEKSPVVRLLGYQCVLWRKIPGTETKMAALEKDPTPVEFFSFGCVGEEKKVSEIALLLKATPYLLVADPTRQPEPSNKQPEGAASSFTPRRAPVVSVP